MTKPEVRIITQTLIVGRDLGFSVFKSSRRALVVDDNGGCVVPGERGVVGKQEFLVGDGLEVGDGSGGQSMRAGVVG